jgi:hypothetical protein
VGSYQILRQCKGKTDSVGMRSIEGGASEQKAWQTTVVTDGRAELL